MSACDVLRLLEARGSSALFQRSFRVKKEVILGLALFTPSAPPLFGLDISTTAVKLVELSAHGRRGYKLERFALEPLPPQAVVDGGIQQVSEVVAAVKRAVQQTGTRLRHVAMGVPASAVITKKIITPANLDASALAFHVENEADQYIPFALEEVHLDYQVLPHQPTHPEGTQEVLIAATQKSHVDERVEVADSAGLKAVVVDMESFAQQAALLHAMQMDHAMPNDESWVCIEIGANAMELSVMRHGEVIFTRQHLLGGQTLTAEMQKRYGLSRKDAEQAKRNLNPADDVAGVLAAFIQHVVLEVQRALQFFQASVDDARIQQVMLFGGSSVLPGLQEAIAERVGVGALLVDPFAMMALAPRLKRLPIAEVAPGLVLACGLALRRFDAFR